MNNCCQFVSLRKIESMKWHNLESVQQLATLKKASKQKPQLIFKHSTRCFISKIALNNFENDFNLENKIDTYLLDLLNHRELSNQITTDFEIPHESPQLLLIKDGKVIYNESHEGIKAEALLMHL